MHLQKKMTDDASRPRSRKRASRPRSRKRASRPRSRRYRSGATVAVFPLDHDESILDDPTYTSALAQRSVILDFLEPIKSIAGQTGETSPVARTYKGDADYAIRKLGEFAKDNPRNQDAIAVAGGIDPLVNQLEYGNYEDQRRLAAMTLGYLAKDNPTNQDAIAMKKESVLTVEVEKGRYSSPDIVIGPKVIGRRIGERIHENVVVEEVHGAMLKKKVHVGDIILNIRDTKVHTVEEAHAAFRKLERSYWKNTRIKLRRKDSGITRLVELLRNDNLKTVAIAARTLGYLAKDNPRNQRAIADAGGNDLLVYLVEDYNLLEGYGHDDTEVRLERDDARTERAQEKVSVDKIVAKFAFFALTNLTDRKIPMLLRYFGEGSMHALTSFIVTSFIELMRDERERIALVKLVNQGSQDARNGLKKLLNSNQIVVFGPGETVGREELISLIKEVTGGNEALRRLGVNEDLELSA